MNLTYAKQAGYSNTLRTLDMLPEDAKLYKGFYIVVGDEQAFQNEQEVDVHISEVNALFE